jgi:hypothetical protein
MEMETESWKLGTRRVTKLGIWKKINFIFFNIAKSG